MYNYKSGFGTYHWTNLCLSILTDKILEGFDEGLLTRMILIDLQNAFDTTNHEIVLKKHEVMEVFRTKVYDGFYGFGHISTYFTNINSADVKIGAKSIWVH